MKIESFEIPGQPLLVPMVPAIVAQREGRERMIGPVTVAINAFLVIPQCDANQAAIYPAEGPDVVALAYRVTDALDRAGVIGTTMQVASVTAAKQYADKPGITITIMEV